MLEVTKHDSIGGSAFLGWEQKHFPVTIPHCFGRDPRPHIAPRHLFTPTYLPARTVISFETSGAHVQRQVCCVKEKFALEQTFRGRVLW